MRNLTSVFFSLASCQIFNRFQKFFPDRKLTPKQRSMSCTKTWRKQNVQWKGWQDCILTGVEQCDSIALFSEMSESLGLKLFEEITLCKHHIWEHYPVSNWNLHDLKTSKPRSFNMTPSVVEIIPAACVVINPKIWKRLPGCLIFILSWTFKVFWESFSEHLILQRFKQPYGLLQAGMN